MRQQGTLMKQLPTWTATWRMIRYRPLPYAVFSLLYLIGLGSRAVPGLVLRAFFDRLTGDAPAAVDVWTLLGLLFATETARIVIDFTRTFGEETFRYHLWALLRRNIVTNVLRRPGADPLPFAPGDTLSRLRGDVGELADWPSWLPYVAGQALFALIALIVMIRIDPVITAVAVVPMVAVVVLVNAARDRLLHYDHTSRDASSEITGFLGEVLDGITAVKAAVAEQDVVTRLDVLNEARRRAELRFGTFWAILDWAHGNIADLALGLILLLAGRALRTGQFTVGDFALFVSYVRLMVDFPGNLGGFLADYRTQAVSIERLLALQPNAPPETLVAADLPSQGHPMPKAVPLTRLDARGLTYRYPGTGRGIEAVDLTVRRGELVIVTGRVGAGKTTLLRILLGLLPGEAGEIRWNGARVDDPASFFRPPQSAYTPQVPRLFSESLRENLLLGLPATEADLTRATHLAVLEPDLPTLSDGLDTLVGPRGVRLSGGQVQRAAAARMFVRASELLVMDDVSSALDVETEHLLWQRLSELEGMTCLAVSHRRPALQHADRIVVLHEGQVEAEGALEDLLATSPAMQEIWQQAGSEAEVRAAAPQTPSQDDGA